MFGNLMERRLASVLCDGLVRHVEDRFGKGELEHDLALIVRHFEDRTQEATLGAFGLQQFPDHRPRDFPCAIEIPQFLAFGIGDQFIADMRVEKKSGHCSKPLPLRDPV